jgi:hypothetical protein
METTPIPEPYLTSFGVSSKGALTRGLPHSLVRERERERERDAPFLEPF